MANSKSTIYPVQLQGAELNLNKLDAEIKQYSGFNKNNSPFVGGCLSNVFIKNSALEDHNDSNTYIAENGDVYTVTTEGLFKNSEKLEDYTGKDFIAVEKINAPRDCVKAFAEDLFLRIVDENVFLNNIQFDTEIKRLVDTETFITKYSCGVWVGSVFVFAFWGRRRGYTQNKLFLVALEKNESGEYEILKRDDRSFYNDWDISSVSYESPIAILATEDSGRTYIQVTFFSGYDTVSSRNHYAYFDDSGVYFESSVDTVSGIASAYATGWTYNSSAANINGTGKYKVNLLSYPRNELVYDWISFKDNSTIEQAKKTAIRISLNVKENFENLGNGYVLKNANVLQTLPAPGSGTPYTEQNTPVYVKSKLFDSSILRCYGIVVEKDSGTYFENLGTPFCVGKDENDNYITVGGSTVLLDNCPFGVLLNNGVVSGIAACQAGSTNWAKNNCTTKILVTNWNTVKESLITYIPEEGTSNINLIYGDYDGNFFILKKTDVPTLKKVNNQVVTNVLYNHNSYFLDRQENGYFAPGFNVSAIKNDNLLQLGSSNYKAASINEYKLEDNASILLNPFECFAGGTSGVEVQMFAKVNIYRGSPDCKYWYSLKIINGSQMMSFTDTELQGLPFPIDTNGNVSYSPSLFSEIVNVFGNRIMIKENKTLYFLQVYNNEPVMSFYMAGGIENITDSFIIQGQYYVILDNSIYSFQFENGVSGNMQFIVDVSNLQFVGNTPYEALFFSKTNRCLYSFTGANVLNQKQLIDKISEVRSYLYNPATQTVFLITDIGVLFYGLFGVFLLEYTNISKIFLLENGIVMSDNSGNYRYIKYYLDEGDTDYVKENINIETCFYGMNNEVVTINDCLYFRLFSEEHEEGDLKVSATTISLSGRKTEETTFKIKATDWDKITHTIYLRYQPKAQRGLGVSFSINSPFKIASLSVGSQPDAVLIDKVSKGAITAPQQTSNNIEW